MKYGSEAGRGEAWGRPLSKLAAATRFPPFRFLDAIVILVLVICLACPILEMFDHWDHTAQTGQDSESAFVILAVCAGAIIAFSSQTIARKVALGFPHRFIQNSFRLCLEEAVITSTISSVIGQSPPVLRI